MITVSFTPRAQKDIARLNSKTREKIKRAIDAFADGILFPIPLTGDWKGWYKIRVGSFRILLCKKSSKHWIVGYVRPRHKAYRR